MFCVCNIPNRITGATDAHQLEVTNWLNVYQWIENIRLQNRNSNGQPMHRDSDIQLVAIPQYHNTLYVGVDVVAFRLPRNGSSPIKLLQANSKSKTAAYYAIQMAFEFYGILTTVCMLKCFADLGISAVSIEW